MCHPFLGDSLFSHFQPLLLPSFLSRSGEIRNGNPSMRVKVWKFFRTKSAQKAKNGLVWIPQGHELLCNPLLGDYLFPFSAPALSFLPLSGVIRNGRGKNMEKFWDKISLTGCKWSRLNAPGSGTSWCRSLWPLLRVKGRGHLRFDSSVAIRNPKKEVPCLGSQS